MRKFFAQACGHEPEPAWMSCIGALCAFAVPAVVVIASVAFGWGI